jgi:two-component system nitrogen regulation response regulator NtrX
VRILVVDDEAPIREVLSQVLKEESYVVQLASSGEEALMRLEAFRPHITFLDIWMPGALDGLGVLLEAKKRYPDTQFVMISGHGTIETAVKATKMGAWDFIEKPLSMDRIFITISNILHFLEEQNQKKGLLLQLQKTLSLVGSSSAMTKLKESVSELAAKDPLPVLIVGERGSGRRLVGQNIHLRSLRAAGPWLEVSAKNSVPELWDAELWGWKNQALVGHEPSGVGKVSLAEGGSLLVHGVEGLEVSAQQRIAQALRQGRYYPLGASEDQPLDVRWFFVTDSRGLGDLSPQLKELCYVVTVPSLKERPEDIPALFWHFSDQQIRHDGSERKTLSPEALRLLQSYDWPGNLIEFRNFVERLYLLTPSDFIYPHDLYFAGLPVKGSAAYAELDFRSARAQFERHFLQEKLKEFDGNISKTAEAIGLERSYLHRKLKSYGIHTDE